MNPLPAEIILHGTVILLPAKEEEKAEAAEPKEEKAETSEVAKAETNEVSDEAVEAEKEQSSEKKEEPTQPKRKSSKKASALKAAADNEWIERFTTTFARGAENVDGQLVWTPTNANADHRFVYRVNYAFSGEFELPAGSVEIRVPKQILKDRFGNYDDYYDIAIPLEQEAEADTKFVYEEDGDELKIWNIKEVSAGESGTIEVSYLTKDKTFYYKDMEAHDPFYGDIKVTNAGQEVSAHADAAPVHINTNSVIVDTDKRKPTLFRTWDSSFGPRPADADDYLYIRWEVRTHLNKNNTQPYDFSLADVFDDGDVVGYKFEGQSTYSTNNTVRNVYQSSDERYDYVITRHSKADFADIDYTVWNNITATVHPIDLLDPDTEARDREPFEYEKPVYRYPPGHFYADKFGQYTDVYTTGIHPTDYGIVQDSEDISDYDLEAFVDGESDKLNDPHLKYYTYVRGFPYPWTLPKGATGDDPSQYGTRPVKYELWDETIDIEDNEPLVGGEDYEFSQLHFIFNFEKATFNQDTLEFDTRAAVASDFTDANKVIFYAKKAGDTEYVRIGEYAPGTSVWNNVNSSYVDRVGPSDVYFKSDVIGYKIETSNAFWYTILRAYPHLTLFRNEKTLSQVGDANKVRIDNTAHIKVTDADGKELFPGDAENSRGGLFKDGMVNSDYVMKVQRQSNIEKYVSGTRNNKAKKTFTVTWRINMEESYTDNDGRHQIEQSSGKFYDLCPIGSHPDKKSVIVYDNGTEIDPSYYDVSVKPNYKDSGRDLLIVDIKKPGTKYSMYYDTIHEWEDLSQVEFKIFNSVAYQTGNKKLAEGYPDNGGTGKDKAVLKDLDPDNDDVRFIYSQDWHDVDLVVATSTGINKKVRAEEDAKYSYDTMTYVDGNYSYRWRVANDDVTKLKDIVLFDSMENFTKSSENIASDWHGYVQSVDTAMLKEQGIFPVVYYSSLENMDIYDHHDLNETINGERVWKVKSEFEDISNAKAIAIDCSKTLEGDDFILDNNDSLETFVNMKAPAEGMNLGRIPYAYNNIFLSSTKIDPLGQEHPDLIHQDYTRIGYKIRGDVDFYKVDKKNHDTKIEGLTFRIYGKSDYGTDIDAEAVSTADGHVVFKDIEQGTYNLREIGGSDDWQVDREIKHVTIDETGKCTIDGLSKDGLINRYYVWENEARIHADIDFTKRSHQRNEEAKEAIDAIKAITPGSADTVTIDGKEFFVLVNENDTRALLLSKYTTHAMAEYGRSFRWESSLIRHVLNEDYLSNVPTISDLVLPSSILTKDHVDNTEVVTKDNVFVLTEADCFGTINIGGQEAQDDDYTYNSRIIVTPAIKQALSDYHRTGYNSVIVRDARQQYNSIVYNLDSQTLSGAGTLRQIALPAMWVSIADVPDRAIPNTKFVLSGTSDYGNEIYETGTTGSNGKLTFSNIEQGTYILIETEANEDYIPNTGKQWTVVVDKNGLVNILSDNETIEQKNSNYIIRNIPRYHNFDIRKVDAMSGEWLKGATFHLYGTSNIGTATDMTVTTGDNGKAEFIDVEAGTYLIKETAAPDKHMIDPKTRVVTIDDFGTVTIEGLSPNEYGEIEWDNERALEGKIVITKVWKDNKTDAERPVPKVTISTKKPMYMTEAYAVFDSADGSLTFFRDEKNKYRNGQTSGTKTYYTGIETSTYSTTTDVPWDSKSSLIKSVNTKDKIKPISTACWFANKPNLTDINLSKLDTSNVSNMEIMFYNCPALEDLDVSNFDTSNVTNMRSMFASCQSLTNLDLSGFDTSNVTNMSSMFDNCWALTSVDVSKFDTSNVTGMGGMFNKCKSLTNLDLSNFDTSKAISMRVMFSGCENLASLDLSNFNTSNVTVMDNMFSDCFSLTSLNVSNFDTSKVTDMSYMFENCKALTSLDLSSFDTSKVTYMNHMFDGCSALTSLDVSSFDTLNVTTMYDMFYKCQALASLDVGNFDTSKVKNMGGMFYYCEALTSLDLSNFNTLNVTNMDSMFQSCSALPSLDLSNFNTSSVTNMSYMFYGCRALTSLDVSSFDTSNVKSMNSMFSLCSVLTNLDLSGFDTSNVTDMSNMFNTSEALTLIDVSSFDTSKVTNMWGMFSGCSALPSLDVSSFDTSKVTSMGYMFGSCYALTTIYASALWDTSNVTNSGSMFFMSSRLPNFNSSVIDKTNAHYNEGGYLTYKAAPSSGANPAGASVAPSMSLLDKISGWDILSKLGIVQDVYAAEGDIASGIYDNVDWRITADGELIIGKEGETQTFAERSNSYDRERSWPWKSYSSQITSVRFDGTVVGASLMNSMFSQCTNVQSIDFTGFDASRVTDMSYMFSGCRSVTSFDFSTFDTSNVVSMQGMFRYCESMTNLDLTSFNTSHVTDMSYMFSNCELLETVDVSSFNTSNVTDMNRMFGSINSNEKTGFKTLDLSNFDTSNVTNMAKMFCGCTELTNLDISSFDTSHVTNMSEMFMNCTVLPALDVSHFDTSNVTDMMYMFTACQALDSIDVSNFDTSKVTNMGCMFQSCNALTSLDLSNFDTSNVTDMRGMFYRCRSLVNIDVSSFDTSNVPNMRYMFCDCNALLNLDVSNFDTSNVADMNSMFSGCKALTQLDLSNFNTPNVTNMCAMFSSCKALTSLDVSNFDTSKVTDMNSMFDYCNALTSLDVSGFDTSSATRMSYMFEGCTALTSLDVSSFDTSNVTEMKCMFYACRVLTSLDASNFDTSKVTDMSYMFCGCSGLTNLDVSNFDTSRVTNMGGMFNSCGKLKSLDISNFDTSNVTNMSDMFTSTLNKIVLGENFVIPSLNNNLNLGSKWQRIATESGRKVKAGPLLTSAELASTYNGATDHGIYLKEGTDPSEYGIDVSETYTTLDENWVKNGDGTWTYTFDVYDDEVPFYGFEDLVEGYDVEFDEDNQFIINEDGTITKSATITNTSNETGTLHITKRVTGTFVVNDLNREFEFKVTLTNENEELFDGTKEYGGVVYKNGVATFKLKNGQSKDLTGIPLNTTYLVEETPVEKFNSNIANASGVLTEKTPVNVSATNAKINVESRNIAVTKTVDGVVSTSETFTFKALFKGLNPGYTYSMYNTSTNSSSTFEADAIGGAVVTFALKDGATATFNSLPVGATYVITEEGNECSPSYEITDSSGLGTIVKKTDSSQKNTALSTAKETVDSGEDVTVAFTNTKPSNEDGTLDLNLLKKDRGTNEPLAGATFNLNGTSENGEEIDINLISDSNGKLKFKKLETGTYQLKEIKSPAGYEKDGRTYTVHVNASPSKPVVETRISKTPNVNEAGISESDCANNTNYVDSVTIPGAKKLTVELTYSNIRGYMGIWAGKYDTRSTSDFGSNDQIHLDGSTGSSPSIGYVSGQDHKLLHKTFTVDGDSVTFLHYNYALSSEVPGYNENTNYGYYAVVTADTSDPQGITIDNLDCVNGEYVVYNTPVPTTSFSFKKIDSVTGTPLNGARFSLSSGNTVIERKASGNDGVVSFEGLAFGEYKLREIEAPDGYELSDEEYTVTLNSNKKISHTSNVSDAGVKTIDYSHNMNTNEVVTIPGAEGLKVELYYNGESVSYDWLSVWKGNYPSYTAYSNRTSAGYVTTADGAPNNNNKFGGSQSGTYTVNGNTLTNMGHTTLQFEGDTVTFGFKSDGSGVGNGYGYYAIVSAVPSKPDVVIKDESGSEVAKDDGLYIISNEKSPVEFILKKIVKGADGDKSKKFDFSYVLTDASPNTTYSATCAETTVQITTDASGSATGTLRLADNESYVINDLPEGAKMIVTELANDHKAEYRAVMGNSTSSLSNPSENTALATEQLTVTNGGTVVFTNTRDIVVPIPTGMEETKRTLMILFLVLSAALAAIVRTIRKRNSSNS